jgi:hypothetical protein
MQRYVVTVCSLSVLIAAVALFARHERRAVKESFEPPPVAVPATPDRAEEAFGNMLRALLSRAADGVTGLRGPRIGASGAAFEALAWLPGADGCEVHDDFQSWRSRIRAPIPAVARRLRSFLFQAWSTRVVPTGWRGLSTQTEEGGHDWTTRIAPQFRSLTIRTVQETAGDRQTGWISIQVSSPVAGWEREPTVVGLGEAITRYLAGSTDGFKALTGDAIDRDTHQLSVWPYGADGCELRVKAEDGTAARFVVCSYRREGRRHNS